MGGGKSERVEKILIFLLFVLIGVKKWRDEKKCVYKFTHIPLLKNEALLKQTKKSDKKNHPNLLGNKNHI